MFNTSIQHWLTKMEIVPYLSVRRRVTIECSVDDLSLFADQESLIEDINRKLGNKLQLKDHGRPTQFIGMDLKWLSDGSLTILQMQLIKKLLMETGMENAKSLGSPVDQSFMVNNTHTTTLGIDQHAMYKSIIESLMYVTTRTRSDLAVAASMFE